MEQAAVSLTRCSDAMRSAAVDPVGTAGSYSDFLLVEHPLPWPRDIGDLPFGNVTAPGRRVRVQAVIPHADIVAPDRRRIIHLSRSPDGPFAGFRRTEVVTTPDDVVAACDRLMRGEADGAAPSNLRDVLVCTHGRRDRCCGSLGPQALARLDAVPEDVRVWRTSHTGGHRFAPTAITFPDGNFWAYLDDDSLGALVDRRAPAASLVRHHRGCSGLDSPAAQAVDRDALAHFGWGWTATPRTAHVDGSAVELRYDGGVVRGTVETIRRVAVPDCGRPATGKEKTHPELRVTAFRVTQTEAAMEVVRRHLDAVARGADADAMAADYALDAVLHRERDYVGHDAIRAYFATVAERLAGGAVAFEDVRGEGDAVRVRWRIVGGPGDGTSGHDLLRVVDGRIVEQTVHLDGGDF